MHFVGLEPFKFILEPEQQHVRAPADTYFPAS